MIDGVAAGIASDDHVISGLQRIALDALARELAAPPHSTPQRCMSPFSSGAMTWIHACGFRNMNWTSVPSI